MIVCTRTNFALCMMLTNADNLNTGTLRAGSTSSSSTSNCLRREEDLRLLVVSSVFFRSSRGRTSITKKAWGLRSCKRCLWTAGFRENSKLRVVHDTLHYLTEYLGHTNRRLGRSLDEFVTHLFRQCSSFRSWYLAMVILKGE